MKNNLDAYSKIDKEKKKKSPIMIDVQGSIDSFNHAVGGIGNIPGTGISEAVEDDIPVTDDIFKAVLKQFPTTDFPEKGACFILQSGKFLDVKRAHGEVDEFIVENFPEINLLDYPNGYLVDSENCVRLNDGRGASLTFDRYITLPKFMTTDQIDAIEKWLEQYPYDEITVSDTGNQVANYSLVKDGISYIMNRIKKYKTTKILSEDIDDQGEELPNVAEDNIIGDEDAGISSMFIDAINDCWNAIDNYHSMIVTLDSLNRHEFDETLSSLLEDRNKEVGSLQGILELLTPGSNQIEQGKEEAQDQVAFDEVHEEVLNENKYAASDIASGDIVVVNNQHKLSSKANLFPILVNTVGAFGPNTFSGKGYETMNGEYDVSWIVYKASSIDDAREWIDAHKGMTVRELSGLTESVKTRKSYSELTEYKKLSLKEAWASNGSLEDFDPETLVQKAFDNKYATNSVREFKDKLLYINIDPGFVFGQRSGSDKIWIDVVEIDKETNEQQRIYMESAPDKQGAIDLLISWKEEYMNGEPEAAPEEIPQEEPAEDSADIQDIMDNPDEGEL